MFARLRSEQGFGLIELMISLLMLNVGILAIIAGFNSGTIAVSRAGEISTASVVADEQMELYRALNWSAIALNSTALTTACADGIYAGQLTPCATQVTSSCSASLAQCNPMRTATGIDTPNRRTYRVDTYIVSETPPSGRPVKRITVVVHKPGVSQSLARITSTFDASTG